MDVEQELRRILQNNVFGKIGKSHRSKCFKDLSESTRKRWSERFHASATLHERTVQRREVEIQGWEVQERTAQAKTVGSMERSCLRGASPVEGSSVAWFIAVRLKQSSFSFLGKMIGQGLGGTEG